MNKPTNGTAGDARFDDALRGHHAASLEQLSPRTRAQLAQRRNGALRGERVAPVHGMRYAAGFAAICALAIGLQFGMLPTPGNSAAASIASATTGSSDATMLDEDPEFYAWLASADAQLVAKE